MARRDFLLQAAMALVLLAMLAGMGAYIYRGMQAREASNTEAEPARETRASDGTTPARLSAEARKNLGIVSKPVQLTSYWRTIEIPGVITDRPGISDRGVVAPVTGIVTAIHAYPGDTVAPRAPLFSLRLVSESLHTSQLELFKASKEIEIARQQRQRLEGLAQSGGVPGSRVIEIDNQIQRMEVNVQAYRQDLRARGLPPDRIDAAADGEFVTEIAVRAPDDATFQLTQVARTEESASRLPFTFEVQRLHVELGQQVEAGEVLCQLADHRVLQIEGRGFKKDMAQVQEAARRGLPLAVAFEEPEGADWPPLRTQLQIHHVANVIDTQSRTFAFYLHLENQWQVYRQQEQQRVLWRFRPGARVRLSVAVEKLEDVFVLPLAALEREGPEAFVFRQNGDLFDRLAVHVLYEDSASVVLASDGKLRPGFYIAQHAAAAINRVWKAQLASGTPSNVHVHADGTVHEAH